MPDSPINKEALVVVATIGKPYGIDGGATLIWRSPLALSTVNITTGDFLFIEIENLLVPFELTAYEELNPGAIAIYLDRISNPDEAEKLRNCPVWVPKAQVRSDQSEVLHPLSLLGETLIHHALVAEDGQPVGVIADVEIYPLNAVLNVELPDGRQALLPFSHELVLAWPESPDEPLRMVIPTGLLE